MSRDVMFIYCPWPIFFPSSLPLPSLVVSRLHGRSLSMTVATASLLFFPTLILIGGIGGLLASMGIHHRWWWPSSSCHKFIFQTTIFMMVVGGFSLLWAFTVDDGGHCFPPFFPTLILIGGIGGLLASMGIHHRWWWPSSSCHKFIFQTTIFTMIVGGFSPLWAFIVDDGGHCFSSFFPTLILIRGIGGLLASMGIHHRWWWPSSSCHNSIFQTTIFTMIVGGFSPLWAFIVDDGGHRPFAIFERQCCCFVV